MKAVSIAIMLCALASPALAQDGDTGGLVSKIVTLLWLVFYVALATVVHLVSMAATGVGLKEKVEEISIGIGPLLTDLRPLGAPVQFKLLPVSGSVKFGGLGMMSRIFVPAIAVGMLILIAILLGGREFAIEHALSTLSLLWYAILSFDIVAVVGVLMQAIQTYPFVEGLAAVFAGMAALNALPLMILNGGQAIWGLIGFWTKTEPTEWAIMEKVMLVEVLIVVAVLVLFLVGLVGWFLT